MFVDGKKQMFRYGMVETKRMIGLQIYSRWIFRNPKTPIAGNAPASQRVSRLEHEHRDKCKAEDVEMRRGSEIRCRVSSFVHFVGWIGYDLLRSDGLFKNMHVTHPIDCV